MPVDLNQLRAAVIANQHRGTVLPANPAEQVVVDKDGNVKIGNEVRSGDVITQVPQETFAMFIDE